MQELDYLRIHRETQKYLEIDNIFNRLSQNYISRIYQLFKEIFQAEHEYTIQELLKLAIQKEIPLKEFKLAEHYKLNSNIFKANLMQIVNVMVDDNWVQFNKQILIDEKQFIEPRLLTQIDEESHMEMQSSGYMSESIEKLDRKSLDELKSELSDRITINTNQMKITPRQMQKPTNSKNNKQNEDLKQFNNNTETKQNSSRIPLQRLLSTDRIGPTSIISSPRHSKENSISISKAQQSIQNSKKKNASIIKNKSMDLKQFAEGLLKTSPKTQQIGINNLSNLMQKMQFSKENNITK